MTYPTDPALSQAEAQHPTLWDGLAWLYLPGHNDDADIINGDVLARNQSTTIDTTTYPEGVAEVYNLGYRVGTATPLEGATAHTFVVYWQHIGGTNTIDRGVLGTAPTVASYGNSSSYVVRQSSSGSVSRHLLLRTGDGVAIEIPNSTPIATQITFFGKDQNNFAFIARNDEARYTSATVQAGAITSTSPIIIGSYYDHGPRRMPMAFFWGGLWTRALTLDEQATLAADQYAVFRKGAPVRRRSPLLLTPW